jgi:hypothetical protein
MQAYFYTLIYLRIKILALPDLALPPLRASRFETLSPLQTEAIEKRTILDAVKCTPQSRKSMIVQGLICQLNLRWDDRSNRFGICSDTPFKDAEKSLCLLSHSFFPYIRCGWLSEFHEI